MHKKNKRPSFQTGHIGNSDARPLVKAKKYAASNLGARHDLAHFRRPDRFCSGRRAQLLRVGLA